MENIGWASEVTYERNIARLSELNDLLVAYTLLFKKPAFILLYGLVGGTGQFGNSSIAGLEDRPIRFHFFEGDFAILSDFDGREVIRAAVNTHRTNLKVIIR